MRRFTLLLMVVAMGVAALAACGGSSKKGSPLGGLGATSPTKGGGSSDTSSSGGNDEFQQLTEKAKTARIKITYKQSDGDDTTIAQDGNGKSMYKSGSSVVITDGQKSVSCDGAGSDATCTEIPGLGGGTAGLASMFSTIYSGLTKLNSSVYGGHVSSDTIAGRDARCVQFKASDFGGLAALGNGNGYDASAEETICVDKETGFLLKLESKSDTKTEDTFLATEVGEPSDSDFTPPVTPQTIPQLPGGITLPTYGG